MTLKRKNQEAPPELWGGIEPIDIEVVRPSLSALKSKETSIVMT
jgi:hypothetical protein